ncbi:hypothetical protein BDZ94DRAFT_75155 [Collybia nuda]|uniref:Uncharacterized protein n=1 Tax=Collybia nuda TaxID=64659 RepID=A0A9P5XW42_9AGAR|nr:hypothetical protein BDZ94DRAFT_75155 [Collybia nuda]
MLAHLFDASPEILQKIAFFAILSTPRGPPRDLYNLCLVCRASNRILSISNAQLYSDTFTHNFDHHAPKRRLGRQAFRENVKRELQRRFTTLKVFRRGNFDDPHLTEALWVAYLMLEDSGASQKNFQQLIGFGLRKFLDDFLRSRLYDGSQDNNGWPLPNEKNSLAIALFWLSSSQSSVSIESDAGRNRMMQLLQPFVFAAFRYPVFTTAESCFDPTTFDPRSRVPSIHGSYPPLPLDPREVPYFGNIAYTACVPPAPLFASLLYFVRHERMEPAIPPHLIEAKRQTREEADALGQVGPTIDDMLHFIHHCRTRFAEFPATDIGVQSPSLTLGQPTPYRLGTLTGRWQGSYIMPFMEDYRQWLNNLPAPSEFPATGRFPLYATLQEHYTRDINSVIPRNGTEQGTLNAWLPSDCRWVEKPNGIEVFDSDNTFRAFYETYKPGERSKTYDDVVDVLITGKTDDRHAAAWGGFHFLGRIRLPDGLMVVSREALGGTGTELLRGYVTSSQNLVGRRKHVSDGTEPAYWESTFSLCKDHTTPALGITS